jgi:serine/threonine protein kinase
MTKAERHLMTLFAGALEFASPPERAAYLDRACGKDQALRQHLEALLEAHAQVGRFLEPQVAVAGATPPAGEESGGAAVDHRTALPPAGSEAPGTQIGPYKVVEPIGEGGMGTVWMARQQEPVRRMVALKLIKAGMDSKQIVARFEAERQALALMDHPNIARVLDGGATAGGRPYFVMDLVKGVPITQYCDEHRLTPRQRLELFLPVCQAVQHAHQKGIIHRDLKPSNVLVALYDGQPVPKVIDFGVAKAAGQSLTDKTLATGLGSIVGTLEYMSPEQAEVNQLDIETRSDIYSLGVLLYELLTGSPPFSRKELEKAGMLEMLRVIREQEPSRPSTKLTTAEGLPTLAANRGTEPAKLTKLVRGELDWIVMKALEKDRTRRYETASALAADVQRYLHDEPVSACPPSAWYRFRKLAQRNKPAFAVASFGALALVAIVAAGAITFRSEQQRLADRQAHQERLLAEQRQNALERALTAALSGDFAGASKATNEAERLGALPGEVHFLRGQVAFHRGDVFGARDHLEEALKAAPDNVAVRAVLALACYHSGRFGRFEQLARELDTMTPDTPEDFLFKGHVEAIIRPERAQRTLAEALRRRDSFVARSVCAEARGHVALFTDEPSVAEMAVEDAQMAKRLLPGNPFALARSVHAHLIAAGVFEAAGQPGRCQAALGQAGRDARALEPFTDVRPALVARFRYYYVGDEEAALAVSRRATEFRLALMLYRRGEYEQALAAIDRARARGHALTRVQRGFILAELPDGPRRATVAFEDATAEDEPSYHRLFAPSILLLLGRRTDAVQAAWKLRSDPTVVPPWDRDWYQHRLDYLCDRITDDQLLRAAGACRPKLCEAQFQIGLWHLADGDRAGAREHFRKCDESRVFIYWEYEWARAWLQRLEEGCTWPPWIPQEE